MSKLQAKWRSDEHTSELQSQFHLVCRLLLEKKTTRSLAASSLLVHRRYCCTPAAVDCTASATGFFFNHTAPTEIYTLSLHDALPILQEQTSTPPAPATPRPAPAAPPATPPATRSEEHTSELQSQFHLVCRLLLEKKKKKKMKTQPKNKKKKKTNNN